MTKERRKKTGFVETPEIDRLPPHSEEAEQGVLGCCLLSPADCMNEVLDKLQVEAFYDLRHQNIFTAMRSLWDKSNEEFDIVTLQSNLKKHKMLDDVGGFTYLVELPDKVPSAANIGSYISIVLEKFKLRKVIQVCTDAVTQAYEEVSQPDLIIDQAERNLAGVFEKSTSDKIRCKYFTVDDLENFDLENDPNNLVGRRYLTKGSSLMVNGASGRGKSSLLMLRVILWALGRPFFGLTPVKPLSFFVWQTENNEGDLSAAYKGAIRYLGLDMFANDAEYELLRKNIKIGHCPALCGNEFIQFAERELIKDPRDIACLDPLVSFPEGDLNSANGAGDFLRKGLSRISAKTGVTWIINHHTPKPLRDPKNARGKKFVSDYQYAGAGSFDIAGWARASETLEEAQDGVFRYVMAKRGAASGACHPDGTPSNMLWLKHATAGGIHWEQMDPPAEPEEEEKSEKTKGGRPSVVNRVLELGLGSIIDGLGAGVTSAEFCRRIIDYSESRGETVSKGSAQNVITTLRGNKAVKKINGEYLKA